MGYVTYIGTTSPYSTWITANNVTEQISVGQTGQTIHLDDAISTALLAAQPSLWTAASGFPIANPNVVTATGHYDIGTDTVGNMGIGDPLASLNPASANHNTCFGYQAGSSQTIGDDNTVMGYQAMQLGNGNNCKSNVIIGSQAALNPNPTHCVVIGQAALSGTAADTVGNSVYVGYGSGQNNTTGSQNTAVGYLSLQFITTSHNTGVGLSALAGQSGSVTGSLNVAVGEAALAQITSGSNNTAIGYRAGDVPAGTAANKTAAGGNNTFLGYQTGAASSGDPSNGTAVGYQSLIGSNATALGAGTSASGAGSVAIGMDHTGASASTSTQDQIVLGTASHSTYLPGALRITPGAFVASDKYLVVDASGNVHVSATGPAS